MGSLRIHKAMVVTFGLLLSGFVLLVLGHFGDATFNTVAAYVLIGCAFSAWYMMIGIIINDLAGKVVIPMGAPFIK